ncbi:MAG: AEC family transporter [Chloroflexi bacterium]|nr:AEC family transporter [Chloroflexota bacterium]
MAALDTFFTALFTIVVPILLLAAVAFGLGKAGIVTDQRPLARLSLYFFSPALAFQSLAKSTVNASDFFSIILFVILMTVLLGVPSFLLARLFKFDRTLTSAFLLSILFVNAGNYGIPFNQFAFGSDGVARAAIYFTTNSMLANTVAVYIASAGHTDLRASLRAVVKMPVAYAALLGLTFNMLHWSLPEPLTRALDLAATAALPVMLANLGLELARARVRDYDWRVFIAAGIKLLVAPLIALALAALMNMEGLTRSVSVIEASMPTAVMASLIATEFQARSDFVTNVVFISTLGSTITLTLLLLFLGYAPT